MPNTLIPIQTYTLSSAASSVTFSNIPQNYTDLYLVISARVTRAVTSSTICLTFNGSATGYSQRTLTGTGSSTSSSSGSSQVNLTYMEVPGANATSNTFGNHGIYIPNYAGSSNKSVSIDAVAETNGTATYMNLVAGLWSNTAAITSITFNEPNGNSNFVADSTFTLYGISNGVKATGGTLTIAGGYAYHTFTSTGSFLPTQQIKSADFLVIAGGAGGGGNVGGGGGAGGLRSTLDATGGGGGLENKISFNAGTTYTCLVGAGGIASTEGGPGGQGNNSVLSNIISLGGGAGGSTGGLGATGGSGGGGGEISSRAGGSGTAGQGYAGGAGSQPQGGGGGGGAGAVGSVASSGNGGAGGAGVYLPTWSSITGTGANGGYYGGGGGGGAETNSGGAGGIGGGGGGSGFAAATQVAGTANTGGGGGAASDKTPRTGAVGGSGIIIIRYPLT